MLHENAKQRLRRVIPTEYDLTWFDPLLEENVETSVELGHRQIRWDRDDSPTVYPCVILGFDPGSVPRGDIGHIFKDGVYKFPHPTDETVAYTRYSAKPMTGTLNVTVAAHQDEEVPDGGIIPQRAVADSIAMQVFQVLQFETRHLHEQGVEPDGVDMEYAWPLTVRGLTTDGMADTSTMIDEKAVQRRHMQFRVDYAYFHEEEVPAVAAIEYGLGIDVNRDGEFTDQYENEEIRFYDYDPEE